LSTQDSLLSGPINISSDEKELLEYNYEEINKLRRCNKCLLPETFPFIQFDNDGVCNICNNYKMKNQAQPIESLMALIKPYRKNNCADCIVPFSGGRDSTYTLHYVKKELGLRPVSFTYDWGMVTDLARRNIARVCGKLGVENIIVSADIRKKRDYIRKNITAWINKPTLGMVPLFMAGDKYFYYYTKKLKEQTKINLNIWGINNLENTDFKVGFCGVGLNFNKKRNYSLEFYDKMKLLKFVATNVLKNPWYLNNSVFDSFGSFFSRYFYPQKDYYHLFDYLQWNEREIESLIINEYEWETSPDTKSTWRIGDGTAGFYNYIYYNVAGFTEHETFRSNQIREGLISREEGLKLIEEENIPRAESIKWYLSIVGLDFKETIKAINKIPKLYRK
ncbi:MAG: glucosamine 6-phosphate synthetase, partial [Candidatus Hodarchaeota archaeon]